MFLFASMMRELLLGCAWSRNFRLESIASKIEKLENCFRVVVYPGKYLGLSTPVVCLLVGPTQHKQLFYSDIFLNVQSPSA